MPVKSKKQKLLEGMCRALSDTLHERVDGAVRNPADLGSGARGAIIAKRGPGFQPRSVSRVPGE